MTPSRFAKARTFASTRVPLICSAGAIVAVMLVACGYRSDVEWSSRGSETVQLIDESEKCEGCIVVARGPTLGDTTDEAFLIETTRVLRGPNGRYWVRQRDGMRVFGEDGQFVARVGRAGKGPMEFVFPLPTHFDDRGRFHVVDPGNARETIVGDNLELVEERPFIGSQVTQVLPGGGDGRFIVNAWLTTDDGLGHWYHSVRGDVVEESFGGEYEAGPQNALTAQRVLARGRNGRMFAAKRFDYEIEVWADSGQRIAHFRGPSLNRTEVKWAPYNRTDNPLPNEIVGISVDDRGRLWVMVRRARADWGRFYQERTYPNGLITLALRPEATMDSVYTTQVDVVEPARGRIVSRVSMDRALSGFVGPGEAFGSDYSSGALKLAVFRLRYRG